MDKATKKAFREMDKAAVKSIFADKNIHRLLQPFFTENKEKDEFIRKCLAHLKTRRMLLHVQNYVEIADGMEKVKPGRPALNLIFLMALAESVARQRTEAKNNDALAVAKDFFRYIPQKDRQVLMQRIRSALLKSKTSTFRFSSLVRILYDARSKALHEGDYWSFSLLRKEDKEKYEQEQYTHYGILTSGRLGKKGRKRRVSLETALTYEELRDIFIKTAIANIASILVSQKRHK